MRLPFLLRVLVPAFAVGALDVATAQSQGNNIDDPTHTVMTLVFDTHFPGEVRGVVKTGVSFQPTGYPRALVQSWNTIRIIRTQEADYLPDPRKLTFRKSVVEADPSGILPRFIGARDGRVKLTNTREIAGTILVLLPGEVAFQPPGAKFGQTIRADLVEYVAIGDQLYVPNPATRRLEKKPTPPAGKTENLPRPQPPVEPKRPATLPPQHQPPSPQAKDVAGDAAMPEPLPSWFTSYWYFFVAIILGVVWGLSTRAAASRNRCPNCKKSNAGKVTCRHIVGSGRKSGRVVTRGGVEISRTGGEKYELVQDEMECKSCGHAWLTSPYEEVQQTGCLMMLLALPSVIGRSYREGRDGIKRIRH